jgi:hypothetical protein
MNNLRDRVKIYVTQRKSRISVSGISIGFDWCMIVSIAILLFVGGALYGFLLYRGISDGTAFEIAEPEGVGELTKKRTDIERTVELLNSN